MYCSRSKSVVLKKCHERANPASAALLVRLVSPTAATTRSHKRATTQRMACLVLTQAGSIGFRSGEEVSKQTN